MDRTNALLGAALVLIFALTVATGCGEEDGATAPPTTTDDSNSDMMGEPERDPGRVTIHRLNRAEYNNTVQALFGTSLRPADDFPADNFGFGFDNIADVLVLSPILIELYQRAAELLVSEALHVPKSEPDLHHFEAEDLTSDTGGRFRDSGWNLWSQGVLSAVIEVEQAGTYRLAARAFGQQAGDEPAKMAINVNGVLIELFDVEAVQDAPEVYEVEVELEEGIVSVDVEFLNDFYEPESNADRNLIVDWIEAEGPLGVQGETNPLRERLLTCDLAQDGCGREIVERFAAQAWRRPVEDPEIDRLMTFFDLAEEEGDDVETGLALALQAALVSPNFVYRVEIDAQHTDVEPHLVSNYELASRLSYFLWSSMPDEELFELAASGMLHDEAVLEAQVERMLDDPRSDALVENFAGQWLFTRALVDVQPDYQFYPTFDELLRTAMQTETELFFREFLHSDIGFDTMFTADFTYLNARLAEHYGIDGAFGENFERVNLEGRERRGILTHGAVLTVTSYPTRTSAVKRGKWVLEQFLCVEPPPPPPGVEGLVTEDMPSGTLRERLEQHRANPECASCHALMDPIGFGMEEYDGVGVYRTEDRGGFPIDATGALAGGGPAFDGAAELSDVLAEHELFAPCFTEHLYTYALGRGPASSDEPYLEELSEAWVSEDGFRLRGLINRIVKSEPFRYRRGEAADEEVEP